MKDEKDEKWRARLHEIIYESNTVAGKAFDVSLLVLIFTSIIIVMADSIEQWHNHYGNLFSTLEWSFTFMFTLEYLLRLVSIKKPWRYVFSFLGIIDLLAIIPSYLSIFYTGAQSLLVFRGLRLLRVFRIFKLTRFLSEMKFLGGAIKGSFTKISIFMLVVLTLVVILGSLMYLIENGQHGFSNIPDSIYWAIVTITTVGYGDISPTTPLGKFVASIIMLMGYGIIAVPTGILTNEIALQARKKEQKHEVCPGCGKEGHDIDAKYCKHCGTLL
ncbi:ion transporter [Segetibacter koreensis]|uniref:ion transporter n=1 Tax=Segetibacter koreensis TaxID=398037 RepID=UPI00036F0327|nr:ion transporter [Segetibacter koreensis]